MQEKKVSIIIPTYKRSDRIVRAVESALSQNYNNFEVIVVDDNEPDSIERKLTEQKLKPYLSNVKFKYIKHPKNLNGSAARNTGISNSTGEFITFLDDDDEYYSNKISLQSKILSKLDNSWGLCYTGYEKIDRYGNFQYSAETAEGYLLIQALTKNLFIGSGSNFMVRRNVVEELNGFNESFERNQDLEFLVRALMKYKMKYIDSKTFLIHNEIREKKFSHKEIIRINEKYRENFSPIINSLSVKEQSEIYKTLDLWDIRFDLTYLRFCRAIRVFKNSELSIKELVKYVKYIYVRYKTKQSYGFKL